MQTRAGCSDGLIASVETGLARVRAELDGARFEPWEFYRPTPSVELYAPVLQFSNVEQVFPTGFGVWKWLAAPEGRGLTGNATNWPAEVLKRYRRLDDQQCVIYFDVVSYPGTWLIQYWFYYPVDVGPGEHLHDPEHLFVEIDKIGGRIHRVIGAAHGTFASNNLLSAGSDGREQPTLPVFAIVEARKHATAPDANRDGIFTPGLDSNNYLDKAKVWGIRDSLGTSDSQLRGLDALMVAPRRLEFARAVRAFPKLFGSIGPACNCDLAPISVAPPTGVCTRADEQTEACAAASVAEHADRKNPFRILKSHFLPTVTLRAGLHLVSVYSIEEQFDSRGLTGGIGADIATLTRGILPFPGRFALDIIHSTADDGRSGVGFALTFERMHSNLFGTYLGVEHVGIKPFEDNEFDVNSFAAGVMMELPLPSVASLNLKYGLNFAERHGIGAEIRVVTQITLGRRSTFGIR